MKIESIKLNIRKIGLAAILAVLLVGSFGIPTPAHALGTVQFDVNPKQVTPGQATQINFTASFEGFGSSTLSSNCSGTPFPATTYLWTVWEESPGAGGKNVYAEAYFTTEQLRSGTGSIQLPPKSILLEVGEEYKFGLEIYCSRQAAEKYLKSVAESSPVRISTGDARTYRVEQIKFNISTDAAIYRAVKGEKIDIGTSVSLADGSVPVKVGDDIHLREQFDSVVHGFYVASVGKGVGNICGYYSCNFEKETPHATSLPFSKILQLDTSESEYPIGQREIWVFPVLDLRTPRGVVGERVDQPYTNNSITVRLEIYANSADLVAAAKAACARSPSECDASGNPIDPKKDGPPQSSITGGAGQAGVGVLSGFAAVLLSTVNIILGIIISMLRWLVWVIGSLIAIPLLETTLSIKAANIADPMLFGWTLVRDVVNMFFILVLIIIAFGTMLRIETYSYKKLLVNLIVMAMLVNFSLVIGRIIIQIADVVQFTFLPAGEGINGVKALYESMSTSLVSSITNGVMGFTINPSDAIGVTFSIIFQFVLELGIILTFLALAIFMVIRTVGLWVLLVISPLAYALFILPTTAGLAKKWWSTFLKYVIFAPVVAFFLYLTSILYKNGLKILPEDITFGTPVASQSADFLQYLKTIKATNVTGAGVALESLMVYVVILVFMWAGMIVTRQMGIFGANAIVGLAERGMKAPFALGGKGMGALVGFVGRTYSGWVGRKIGEVSKRGEEAAKLVHKAELKAKAAKTPEERAKYEAQAAEARSQRRGAALASAGWRYLSMLNPRVVAEAWKKRREEKELRAYVPAIGHMQDTYNRIIPTEWLRLKRLGKKQFGKKTYHGLVGERAVVAQEAENLIKGVRTREDAARTLRDSFKSGDKDEIMAAFKVLQHGNWQDDYMNLEGLKFSPIRYLNHITEKMREAGFSDEEMRTILDDLKETGEQTGRIRAYGYTTEDDDGVLRRANDLSFYAKLDKEDLAKQFATLAEKFKLAFDETGSAEFMKISQGFDKATVRAKAGESFDKIIDTHYDTEREEQSLREALVSRRFMNEAHIKLQRGNAGTHARNIEAAILVDQDPVEGWTEQNVLGKMIMHELGPNIIESITARIHESQGRLLYGFGAFRDKQTGKWSLPDQNVIIESRAAAATETDPEKKRLLEERTGMHELGWKKIIETRKLSEKFFNAVTTSDRLFTKSQRIEFAKQFNKYIRDNHLNYQELDEEPQR